MHKYRTHNCSELRLSHESTTVKLSGWVHRKRDHGNLLYTVLNIIEQENKYLLITSLEPLNKFNFKLPDLISRIRNCLIIGIKNPDDNLIFALLIKYLSDRQINIDKKLIEFIIKRIDRSYEKIFLFIHKIDKLSLKKGKPINLATIKEALEK